MNAHLIRHGEVENPDHVVYASLPGFGLSTRGRRQAAAAAARLALESPAVIVTSPLQRAIETAELTSHTTGSPVVVDDRLTEWELSSRWAGVAWEALHEVFPGELEAYLEDPYHLPFSPESLQDAAERIGGCVADWAQREVGDLAFVTHQDPLHAAVRWLTRSGAPEFHTGKPTHCSITTLQRSATGWTVFGSWSPES